MTHLLAISIGPVQEFIAAARRTRDLWFGSYLLSEISREAARAVKDRGGQLIFPASLEPDNIANKILAEVDDPTAVVARAKQAAKDCWEFHANSANKRLMDQPKMLLDEERWQEQLADVIEFYAAWVVRTPDYKADRLLVERLLAGRKSCKDFSPASKRARVPKSSLDGQRDSVLIQPQDRDDRTKFRANWPSLLRLSPGEQLDIVGVTKRLGRKKDEPTPSYPSVARVAADTWLRGLETDGKLGELKEACRKLAANENGLNTVRGEKYRYFPYEGTVVFQDRHPDLIEELGLEASDLREVAKALTDLKKLGGEPNPYLAVVVADGDRIGKSLSQRTSAADHREFSQSLAGFAKEAYRIVNDRSGVLIYAGGDDVIAFAPVDQCLLCARDLHDVFGKLLARYTDEEGQSPTLSVGVAIGHFMENLEDLLEYGRAAERNAKLPDRDGLAVHLHKRGGAPIEVRAKWVNKPDERILKYAEALNKADLPGKLAYELRKLADLYEGWPNVTDEEKQTLAAAIAQDVPRLLVKKNSGSGVGRALDLNGVRDVDSLKRLAEELLVARLIAVALRQAEGHIGNRKEAAS